MCYLQEQPFNMKAPKKKARKAKNKTGVEVVQSVLKTPEPPMIVNEQLPSYEEMQQACQALFNGPSSMETQPDLDPVHIMEEGGAVLPEGQQAEWWPVEGEFDVPILEELALQEYLMDASKPLHTNFVLPEQGLALCYTCPVYFGNADSKQTVLDTICNSIHPKIHQEWGTFVIVD